MKRRQILIPACAALLFFGIMLLTEQLLAPPYFVKSLIKLLLICTLIGIGTVLSETGLKESIRFQPMQKAGWLILFMIAVIPTVLLGFWLLRGFLDLPAIRQNLMQKEQLTKENCLFVFGYTSILIMVPMSQLWTDVD